MKKRKFLLIALAVLITASLGLAGCIIAVNSDDDSNGTLKIVNDCKTLPDVITRIIIKEGSASGNTIIDETVSIAASQNKTYSLKPGTYVVTVITDLLFNDDYTVTLAKGYINTLTYKDY
ncbi:MAG: hypothetical protein FWH38_03705 [Treponema sp.]|nr:hypothetical protein [Treponema sp.]